MHTPGPWTSVPNGGDDPDERALFVGKNDAYGDFTVIADCRSKFVAGEIGGDEASNARLIAAAPELLTALEEIVSWGEQATGNSMDAGNARECARIARAAIAKARGE